MGNETPLSRVRAFQRAANPNGDYHWPAEEAANVGGIPLYFDDIEALADTDELDAVEVAIRRLREAKTATATLREQLAAATARAEQAEAAYHRLDSEQAGAGSYAGRAEAAEAEVARLRAHLDAIAAAQESGRAARNRLVEISTAHDLAMLNENCELRTRAEHAEAERDQLRARLAEIPETHLEWGIRFRDEVEEMNSEVMARETAAAWRVEVPKANPAPMCRTVYEPGPWCEADATPPAALEQLAAEQGDEEGGGDE